jgi:hypothetical protein
MIKLTAMEWAKQNSGKFSSMKDAKKACMNETGLKQSVVGEAIRKAMSFATISKNPSKIKNINDFRKDHDIAHKISIAVSSIPINGYITEPEMRDLSNVDANKFARFRDSFSENYLTVKDRGRTITYWASKSMIRKMREIVEM